MDSNDEKNISIGGEFGDSGDAEEFPVNIYSSLVTTYREKVLETNCFLEYLKGGGSEEDDDVDPVKQPVKPGRPSRKRRNGPVDVCNLKNVSSSDAIQTSSTTKEENISSRNRNSANPRKERLSSSSRKMDRKTQRLFKNLERKKQIFYSTNSSTNDVDVEDCIIIDEDPFDSDCVCVDDEYTDKSITAKIKWKDAIIKIVMKKTQKFATILPEIATHCNTDVSCILLCLSEKKVEPSDTPYSLKMTAADILDCYVMKSVENTDKNCITLHIQANDSRKKISIKVQKDQPLSEMMEKYATEREIPRSKLVFKFDGLAISPNETAEDLDMEDDSCVDVMVSS